MPKRCSYKRCRYRHSTTGIDCIKFFPFPKMGRLRTVERCKRWVAACGRTSFGVENVTKHSYLCSEHFVDGQPTPQNPDPIPFWMSEMAAYTVDLTVGSVESQQECCSTCSTDVEPFLAVAPLPSASLRAHLLSDCSSALPSATAIILDPTDTADDPPCKKRRVDSQMLMHTVASGHQHTSECQSCSLKKKYGLLHSALTTSSAETE